MSLVGDPVETPAGEQQTPDPNAAPASGSGNRDWIPEEYRAEKSLESVPDLKTLTKNYVEAQRYIGGSIRVPKDDAPAEEWNKFYAKLGRPEKPEDYQLNAGQTADGVQFDPKLQDGFAKKAHDLGLSTKQAQELLGWYAKETVGVMQEKRVGVEQAAASLKQEWGVLFDRNLALAKRGVRDFGGDELVQVLNETGLGNHPAVVKAFARIGQSLSEDKLVTDDRGDVISSKSAQEKIAKVMSDPNHPYFKRDNPGHAAAVAEVQALYRAAYDQP